MVLTRGERFGLVALALAAVLYALSRTERGQVMVAEAADAVGAAVRGLRLNNPLNIEKGEPWQGLAPDQPDERFAKFIARPWGIRAWARIMLTYRSVYGIRTVRAIVDRFNPVADGQPGWYVGTVADAMGVAPDAPIDVRERAAAFALCRAMMRVELGAAAALLVSDAEVHEGLQLAGISA